jgi:hypothetical protein
MVVMESLIRHKPQPNMEVLTHSSFTKRVEFKTVLQKRDCVRVPKLVRWKFKLDTAQTLKVSIWAIGAIGSWETFYARMDTSGRITIPKLTQNEFLRTAGSLQSLYGATVHVRLEPT